MKTNYLVILSCELRNLKQKRTISHLRDEKENKLQRWFWKLLDFINSFSKFILIIVKRWL